MLPNVIVWQGIADFDQPDSGGAQDEGAFAGDEYRFGLNKRQGYFGFVASAVVFHTVDCGTAMRVDRSCPANLTSVTTLEDFGGWPATLGALTSGDDITGEHAEAVLDSILDGGATDAQIAGYITSLRQKGETVAEFTGMVRSMRKVATPLNVADEAIDIVGMGGSPSRRKACLLYTSPSPRDRTRSRMPSSA